MQLKFFVFLEQTCCCSCHSLRWMRSYSSERLVKLRAFTLSPPYSSSNKRSIGMRLHQWHKLIFLHDCHVILTSISFFSGILQKNFKDMTEKGRGRRKFFAKQRGQPAERGTRQEYYWALEIDVMRGFWVAYAINPGKNERENYRLDMKWFHGDFSSFDKLNSMNFIEHIHRETLHDEIQFWAIEFCL